MDIHLVKPQPNVHRSAQLAPTKMRASELTDEIVNQMVMLLHSTDSPTFSSIRRDISLAFRGKANIGEVKKICDAIFNALANLKNTPIDDVAIDLAKYGKYQLIKKDSGCLQIWRVENDSKKDVTHYPDFSFDQFLSYFRNAKRVIEDFELLAATDWGIEEDFVLLDGGIEDDFVLLPTSDETDMRLVDDIHEEEFSESGEGIEFHESDLTTASDGNNFAFPTYLDPKIENPRLGDIGFDAEIATFLLKNEFGYLIDVAEKNKDVFFSFPDFDLYPLISDDLSKGEAHAKNFIASHMKDGRLVLVPYVVKGRSIGEDHIVLLAVKGNQSTMLDPKNGWFLGDAVSSDRKESMGWQKLLDTTNCGFYVYLMITKAIAASMNGDFVKSTRDGKLGSDLLTFFSGIKDHDPKDIRADMRQLHEKK